VYIGQATSEEVADTPYAYYLHSRDELFLGEYSEDGFEPTHALGVDSPTMGAAADQFGSLDHLSPDLSVIGIALCKAYAFAETHVLGTQQAYVYVLRDVYGFSQPDTAKILDIGVSTVSTHLADARANVEGARTLVEGLDELADDHEEQPAT
jgi:hypothetical protein